MTRPPDPGSVRELFAAPQRRAWARRWLTAGVLGPVAGLFVGLVLDWPLPVMACGLRCAFATSH